MSKWFTGMQRKISTFLLFTLITAAILGGGNAAQAASLNQSTVY
ncbi:hypothetical protein [Paenibacillus sp. ACRRY]|nr:hypothetical protein [Paenibacillus sp. ACRRY]